MDFRIADTFTDSLARLTSDEQKAVKTTAFDLQINPISTGMSFHKLDRAKDKQFWSVRVNADIRLIVHKAANSLLLCYVDHHDKAYHWAERRKLETHPTTGAAQLVEIRERVQEIVVRKVVERAVELTRKPALFNAQSDDDLLAFGVPPEWLADVRGASEDSILDVVTHLPAEASEALLQLATGGVPKVLPPAHKPANPFDHPDAQRRFRVMANVGELEQALAYPWEKWTTFLHPQQRELVERNYSGPAKVAGSAGTGKTIVALHRAVFLARNNPDSRVLLTTFSETLANALRVKLRRLVGEQPRLAERLEVHALPAIAARLYERHVGRLQLASEAELKQAFAAAVTAAGSEARRFNLRFLLGEWGDLVDARQLESWEAYRDVKRLGRKTRLSELHRRTLWAVFESVRERLAAIGAITEAGMFSAVATKIATLRHPPFEFAVVDEAQDLGVAQLRFLSAIEQSGGGARSNALFFAGDLGQRIFQPPFSWKTLGIDVRGRSRTLHINYRTSHQIRMSADRLLGPVVADVDGNVEKRAGTVSVFNGPAPVVQVHVTEQAEITSVATWLSGLRSEGLLPHELAIFVRGPEQVSRAVAALKQANLAYRELDERVETTHGFASICVMHLAKGLEFRAVALIACDDEVIPSQARIESVADDADLEEVYNTERHLLYVACTRARDRLIVSGVKPASEFLGDLQGL